MLLTVLNEPAKVLTSKYLSFGFLVTKFIIPEIALVP